MGRAQRLLAQFAGMEWLLAAGSANAIVVGWSSVPIAIFLAFGALAVILGVWLIGWPSRMAAIRSVVVCFIWLFATSLIAVDALTQPPRGGRGLAAAVGISPFIVMAGVLSLAAILWRRRAGGGPLQ